MVQQFSQNQIFRQVTINLHLLRTAVTSQCLPHTKVFGDMSRLNFSTNSASEIFQKTINEQIRHIPGVLNISDDVIVFGKTQADHDASLHAVFRRFTVVNVTFNKNKCEFNKQTFFGFVFSNKGISPDPNKVEAINNALYQQPQVQLEVFLAWRHIVPNSSPSLVMFQSLYIKWQRKMNLLYGMTNINNLLP